jgi:putative transposase
MGHTYSDNLVHVIFSTAQRLRFNPDKMERACEFMGGIARKNSFHVVAMGSTEDHVHLLLALPPTVSISKAVQLIKGGSSKWFHETFGEPTFSWQEGFAAFSVSRSVSDKVESYIRNQQQHHKKRDFREEIKKFLEKHGISYDGAHILG